MTNTDEKAAAFLARLIRLEDEKRQNAEDRSEVLTEMKSAHLLKEEIAGIKLAVRRHFETEDKRKFRESAEEFADALGDLKDTPLGDAALRHVKNDPGVQRAMKSSEKMIKSIKELGVDSAIHVDGNTIHVTQAA